MFRLIILLNWIGAKFWTYGGDLPINGSTISANQRLAHRSLAANNWPERNTIFVNLRENYNIYSFTRWGIPDKIINDNGGQFTSIYFKEFVKQYRFTHTTVSPPFPQTN